MFGHEPGDAMRQAPRLPAPRTSQDEEGPVAERNGLLLVGIEAGQ